MKEMIELSFLKAMSSPESVVIYGASNDPDKIGGRPISYMKKFGYSGTLIPVNPRRSEVQGLPAFGSLKESGQSAEAAIVAVGGRDAVEAVAEAAECGVRVCVVVSSGFGEGGDEEGVAMRSEMLASAESTGMRIVGPNSQGIACFESGAVLSFSTLFSEVAPMDGPVGIVSQSGAMASVPYAMLREKGIGVRYVYATGNDADLSVADMAESVLMDSNISVLVMYVESLEDADGLRRVGELSRERAVPVLLLYGGTSPTGQRAAASHTGALATEQSSVRAFFRRIGIWLAESIEEVVDTVPIWLSECRPVGPRVAGISSSGASCVLISDGAYASNLETPDFSQSTVAGLKKRLPGFASASNPADVTAALLTDDNLLGDCVGMVLDDGDHDVLVVALPVTGAGYAVETFAESIGEAAKERAIPVIGIVPNRRTARIFQDNGILIFEDTLRAMRAIANVVQHPMNDQSLGRYYSREGGSKRYGAEPIAASPVLLDEHRATLELSTAGVRFAKRLYIGPGEPAPCSQDLASLISSNLIVKAVTTSTAHKSEFGLVMRCDAEESSVARAIAELECRCAANDLKFNGALVCQLEEGDAEFLVGARYDELLGGVAVVGFGGKYAELDPDSVVLVEPFTEEYVRSQIGTLRGKRIFEGFRDIGPISREALAESVVSIGRYVSSQGGAIIDAEVNPVICAGAEVVGVDAVIHRRGEIGGTSVRSVA